MKNRVVFIRSNSIEPDPRVEKEANSILKYGFNVTILGWDRNNKYRIKKRVQEFRYGNSEVICFGIPAQFGGGFKKNLMPLLKYQLNIAKWLIVNRNCYDIIHACDFDTAFTANIFAKILKKKIIYDIFDYYVDSFSVPTKIRRTIEFLDSRLINSVDAVIICSEQRKEQIKRTNPKKLEIIHNSIDTSIIESYIANKNTSDAKSNDETVKIAYIGILQDHRFLLELLDIIKENKKYELHIAGFGKYENYVNDLSNRYKNIVYYGKVKYNEAINIESKCDVMVALYDPVIKNHYYAAPNKFYEALLLGKPLIMVKNTGMSKIVLDNDIGEVIEYDKSSLLEALDRLSKTKDKWTSISNRMKEIYEKEYAWDEMEKRLVKLYYEIIYAGENTSSLI